MECEMSFYLSHACAKGRMGNLGIKEVGEFFKT